MRNNVMSEVAKLLGLLIDEEFMIDEKIYIIDENGLWIKENNQWRASNDLENLLTGRKEFVILPWKPKNGYEYWTFEIMLFGIDENGRTNWNDLYYEQYYWAEEEKARHKELVEKARNGVKFWKER